MCQCPVSGESHFYAFFGSDVIADELCQCPVSGESHFYWGFLLLLGGLIVVCQCPVSGESHFYLRKTLSGSQPMNGVNALSRANPISTDNLIPEEVFDYCVNALSRANPISTFVCFIWPGTL